MLGTRDLIVHTTRTPIQPGLPWGLQHSSHTDGVKLMMGVPHGVTHTPPPPPYALYPPWGVVRGSGGAQGSAPVALGTAVGEVTLCPIVPLLVHPGLAQGHSEGLLPLARPTTPGTALGCPKGQAQEQARGHWPPAARGADADTVPAWRLALGGTLGPIYAGDIGPVPPAELGSSGVLSCDTGIWEGAGLWQCGVTPSPCPAAAQAPEGTASMAPTILPAPTPSTLCTLHQPHRPLHPLSRVPPPLPPSLLHPHPLLHPPIAPSIPPLTPPFPSLLPIISFLLHRGLHPPTGSLPPRCHPLSSLPSFVTLEEETVPPPLPSSWSCGLGLHQAALRMAAKTLIN